MNFCSNCKHCRITDGDYGAFFNCKIYGETDLVTGALIKSDCSKIRERIGKHCPKWEQRESMFDKIKRKLKS